MIFWIQLILSFIVGGLAIALQTLLAERVSNIQKGIILTIPVTLAIGIFFIGLTKSAADAADAVTIVPAALGTSYIFVTVFALLSKYKLSTSLLGGFSAWIIYAWYLIIFSPSSFLISILYCILPIIIFYLIIINLPQKLNLKQFPLNKKHIITRSLLAGSIIALIVVLSKTLGNVWGGIFSTFPATFASTFIIYCHWQGKTVIPAVAKTLFFPGIPGFILYAWIIKISYPTWGIWLGTVVAFLIVFLYFWLWLLFKNKLNKLKNKL